MKTALPALLWRELESLFFSPLAYIVLTVSLLLNGVSFLSALTVSGGVVEDTVRWFFGDGPLFWVSILMIPALVTMRLVAEERRAGTLEVLLTAPVRDGEVIVAKFLGALAFQGFLWAPTLVYVVILRQYGALPDPGQLVTLAVGVACVTSLLTAIGLLFSTRTSNQLVAAVGAIVANVLLFVVPLMIPELQAEGWTRAAAAVSMVEHFARSFGRGLLDTGILAWYASATIALLIIATRSLEARRWR